ncbi:MAG: hypothetical protein FJX76_24820 [Armatimonadetes bacterium]|nr:hypothetical protein [Armatimonadota bacterium]
MNPLTGLRQLLPGNVRATSTEAASKDVHVITRLDATEPILAPFATQIVQQLEEMKAIGGDRVTADVMIDRRSPPTAPKVARGLLLAGVIAAPVAAGVALGVAAGSLLVGAAATLAGWKGARALADGGMAEKCYGNLMSAAQETILGESRWEGRRTYRIEADRTPAIDSRPLTSEPLSAAPRSGDVTDFLVSSARSHPGGLTVVHLLGHGLAYRAGAGMPFAEYNQVLADTASRRRAPADLLLLESCLQGNLEALQATAPHARYAVVSEEILSATVMGEMLKETVREKGDRAVTPREFGAALVDHASRASGAFGARAQTLTLVDMQRVWALNEAVGRLGDLLADEVADGRLDGIRAALSGTETYPRIPMHRYLANGLALGDLKQLAERLRAVYAGEAVAVPTSTLGPLSMPREQRWPQAGDSPRAAAVRSAVDEVLAAMDSAVVARYTDDAYASSGGISVQLPGPFAGMEQSETYRSSGNARFDESAAAPGWKRFVEAASPLI